jgi:hypothetical protein
MASIVRKFSDFDAADIKFGDISKNKNGGKVVYLSHADGGSLLYQLPLLRAPFGLGSNTDKDTGVLKGYTLSLTADDALVSEKIGLMEECVCKFLLAHSEEIWGKQKSLDSITENYNSVIKMPKDSKYKPNLNLKVEVDRNVKILTEAWAGKPLDRVPLDTLAKGQSVTAIIEINQLYFIGNALYGASIRVKQVKFAVLTSLKSCAFLESADTEMEESDEEDEVDVPEDE